MKAPLIMLTAHPENLIIALNVAIEAQTKYEREKLGYTMDSIMVAGWREVKAELEKQNG